MFTTKPLQTHKCKTGHHAHDVNMFTLDEYTFVQILSTRKTTKIGFRNLGKINHDSSIQFSVEETDHTKKRGNTKMIFFSIPYPLAGLFIKQLQKEYKPNIT
jgi:hypothetical protein